MNKINVGKIVGTHSLKGDLKIQIYSNSLDRLNLLDYVYIENETEKFYIENVRKHKNIILLKLKNYNNINDVEKFKNKMIYIDKDKQGIKLEKDEFYIEDLINLKVIDSNNGFIGKITDVIQNKYQDLILVDNKIYIPYVDKFIKYVDLKNKTMYVNLIDGML